MLLTLGTLLSHGLAQGSDASADVKRLIQERRVLMAELGATLRAAWEKLDTGDLATLDREARWIGKEASRISRFFPPGSFGNSSRARAGISKSQEEFRRLSGELQKAAEALAERARTGDAQTVRNQLFQIGFACKACHRKFVKPPR